MLNRHKFLILTLGLLLSCFVGFVYFQFTSVSGVELNIRTLNIRSFSFRRDPFTNHQWTGVLHSPAPQSNYLWTKMPRYSLMDSEIQSRLRPIPGDDRWDLVSFDASFEKAPASILLQLLNTTDSNYQVHWLEWSKQNPKKADVLWPAVHDLVVLDLYEHLPSLFELALTEVSSKELDERIISLIQSIVQSESDRLRSA
ncbi:MAG: hypothetical protein AAGG44_05915, partial [Planctomycetota bacterium]